MRISNLSAAISPLPPHLVDDQLLILFRILRDVFVDEFTADDPALQLLGAHRPGLGEGDGGLLEEIVVLDGEPAVVLAAELGMAVGHHLDDREPLLPDPVRDVRLGLAGIGDGRTSHVGGACPLRQPADVEGRIDGAEGRRRGSLF